MTSIPALTLSAPVNLRDLGGIAVEGGVVRPGFALRADDLALVTDVVARGLVDGGVRAVIDLRSTDELGVTGRGPLGTHATVSYHHVPLLADLARDVLGGAVHQLGVPVDRGQGRAELVAGVGDEAAHLGLGVVPGLEGDPAACG